MSSSGTRTKLVSVLIASGLAFVSETALAESSKNGIAINGIALNGLYVNGLSLGESAAQKLSTDSAGASVNVLEKMVQTESGAKALKVIIQCALSHGESISFEGNDGNYWHFAGELGLAPEWKNNALSLVGQRWISACLLAHVNFFGMRVPISLRGPHPALDVAPEEAAVYTNEEGAFYGNLFRGEPLRTACLGKGGPGSVGSPDQASRVCATKETADGTKTICGFDAVGFCQEACTVLKDGTYSNCKNDGTVSGRVSEVITVFLRADHAPLTPGSR